MANTFLVSINGDDGHLYRSSPTWPVTSSDTLTSSTTGSTSEAHYSWTGSQYQVGVATTRWNTASLAVAPKSALIGAQYASGSAINSPTAVYEWYNINTANYASNWTNIVPTSSIAPEFPADLAMMKQIGVGLYPVDDVSGINIDGYTGVRAHIRCSVSPPTGYNYVINLTREFGTERALRLITYDHNMWYSGVPINAASGSQTNTNATSVGTKFKTDKPITIRGLGCTLAHSATANSSTLVYRIYDTVTSQVVASATPIIYNNRAIGGFVFVEIASPCTLLANREYVFVAYNSAAENINVHENNVQNGGAGVWYSKTTKGATFQVEGCRYVSGGSVLPTGGPFSGHFNIGFLFDDIATAPVTSIQTVSRTRISNQPVADRSYVTFRFNTDVQSWIVKSGGVDYTTGITVESGGAVSANTDVVAEIIHSELGGNDGDYRINIYGQSMSGEWTAYNQQ